MLNKLDGIINEAGTSACYFIDFSFKYRAQKNATLKNINLSIKAGEKILIAGPSGSGKSTLGSCLNGLIPFNNPGEIKGKLLINGVEPSSIFNLSELVGTVLQDTDGQFVGLSSGEDIAFSLENKCRPQSEMISRVFEAAKLVGADGYLRHSPQRLSGGQKQRVSMAGVLVDNAPILLLDEPLAALDPSTGKLAIELIDDIAKETGATVVIIEHRIEDVLLRHIDRVVLVNEGRILFDGTPDEIVVSSYLKDVGVRRPLYVSALEKASVTVTEKMNPGRLDTLVLNEEQKIKVKNYAQAKGHKDTSEQSIDKSNILLETKNVGYEYTDTGIVALDDVSFKLYSGEMCAILGANGAGKSTLAKLICGFEEVKSGKILYKDKDMDGMTIPERAEHIGYVMQNPNQMICKTLIFDEIALGLRARNVAESEIKERVENAMEICGLTKFIKWPVSALSYGQKKRVTIADALVLNPKILILDEPTAGQDWRHYTDIMEFLVKLNKSGVTVLMITHDMHLCLEYAKRAFVFSGGKLLSDSPAQEVLSDPTLAARANLRETSLYGLAKMCGIQDAKTLVNAYLSDENLQRRSLWEGK